MGIKGSGILQRCGGRHASTCIPDERSVVNKTRPPSHIRGDSGDIITGADPKLNRSARRYPRGRQGMVFTILTRKSPLLTPPLLTPPDAYASFEARDTELHLTSAVQPLIEWMRGNLNEEVKGLKSLSALDTDDHVTGGRQ